METYTYTGQRGIYTLTLTATNKPMGNPGSLFTKYAVEYTLSREGEDDPIFAGDDFGPSPMHAPDGKFNASELLGYLTLQLGDTDRAYFNEYTPRQVEFRDSGEAEDLSYWQMDLAGELENK